MANGVRGSAVWTVLFVGATLCFASVFACIFILEQNQRSTTDDDSTSITTAHAAPIPTRSSVSAVASAKLLHDTRRKGGKTPEHLTIAQANNKEDKEDTHVPHLHFPYYVYGKFSEESGTTVPRELLTTSNAETSGKYQSAAERKAIIRSIYDSPTRSLVNTVLGDGKVRSGVTNSDMLALQSEVDGLSASPSRRLFEDHTDVLLPQAQTWALNSPLLHGTRNHDCVALFDDEESKKRGDHVHIVNLLGRYSRHVEVIDMITGQHRSKTTEGVDPSGALLSDLNHVSAVLVDAIHADGATVPSSMDGRRSKQEVWLPCGFHGDAVNSETSSEYVRIVDMDTMAIRVGPKLPSSGGACTSLAIQVLPNEPPMICSFAGTRGQHDSGEFLPQTQCYDRMRERWWSPFGEMPFGLDHGNAAIIPRGTCNDSDSARIIIMNFRTEPYGDIHPEILAHDLPDDRWTMDQLESMDREPNRKGGWYVYHNITDPFARPEDVPRDAAGIVVTDGGRHILNFGGQAHDISMGEHRATGRKRHKIKFNMIRSLDVCEKKWTKVGDMGLSTFALQSCASHRLQVAFTCGGEAPLHNSNSDMCIVSRLSDIHIDNQHVVM